MFRWIRALQKAQTCHTQDKYCVSGNTNVSTNYEAVFTSSDCVNQSDCVMKILNIINMATGTYSTQVNTIDQKNGTNSFSFPKYGIFELFEMLISM